MRRFVVAVSALLAACATVRQQDLAAWVGVPVEALDTHSFFLTVPLIRTRTESGIEIRNYANGIDVARCTGSANANVVGSWVNANAFTTCTSGRVACNNLFYIRDGKVLEYAPTGRCYTDATVQPQARYRRLNAAMGREDGTATPPVNRQTLTACRDYDRAARNGTWQEEQDEKRKIAELNLSESDCKSMIANADR